VLFINYNKAQLFEAYAALQQLVGTDYNIYRAIRQSRDDLLLLFATAKARQALYPHRPVGKAVSEILEVLLRQ